jgi:hypothetical protein
LTAGGRAQNVVIATISNTANAIAVVEPAASNASR